MNCIEYDVDHAIDMSKAQTKIIILPYSCAAFRRLKEECEWHNEGNNINEFGGKDIDGNEWRVHIEVEHAKV